MRSLEIVLPFLLATYLVFPSPRPLAIRHIPTMAIALAVLHLIVEGYRWQMIPIYALTLILASGGLINPQSPSDWKPLASYFMLGLLALSTALPALLPVPRIPAPSGPLAVGTRIYELTDESRREIYSGKEESRRFMIQIWYPSEASSSNPRASWVSEAKLFAPAISGQIGMPSFFLDHLALVKIPAYRESEVAKSEARHPVILFSHGWNGFNAQNTGQALELASRGYVVVGVQHTYGAVITVFPDGDVAMNNPAALPDGAPMQEYENAAHILSEQWADDLGFTLDYLQSQNADSSSAFFEQLDLKLVGVYGHSTGGGAAIQFCGTDPRCIALLGMDPFMRPVSYEVIENGVTQPSFFMFSQRWRDDIDSRNNELFGRFFPHVRKSFGVISIDGTAHYDFTDLPLLSPLAPTLGLKGPINGNLVTAIVNDYLVSFFDETLKGASTSLFTGSNKYPEVRSIQ